MAPQVLPRGIRLNNPGNLRRSNDPWQGLAPVQNDPEFFSFQSAEWGVRALARTLITYQDRHLCRTIRQMVTRWAPPSGNSPVKGRYTQNTAAYVHDVAARVGIDPDEAVDAHAYAFMRLMVPAMIAHECANYHYPAAVIDEGLRLAGIAPPARVDRVATTAVVASGVSGAVGAVDLVDLVGTLGQAKDSLAPLAESSGLARGLVVALAIGVAAIGAYLIWRRYVRARAVAS